MSSCFSGLSFYRAALLLGDDDDDGCVYSCRIIGGDFGNTVCDCEHVALHDCLRVGVQFVVISCTFYSHFVIVSYTVYRQFVFIL